MISRIHRPQPRGRPMPKPTRRANAHRAAARSRIEHVLAHQRARMGLTVRTVGLPRARARAAITLANTAYNMTRWRWLDGRAAPARPGPGPRQPLDDGQPAPTDKPGAGQTGLLSPETRPLARQSQGSRRRPTYPSDPADRRFGCRAERGGGSRTPPMARPTPLAASATRSQSLHKHRSTRRRFSRTPQAPPREGASQPADRHRIPLPPPSTGHEKAAPKGGFPSGCGSRI